MVRDLLSGFAARHWSAELDLGSLTPLPASYVSHDLRQPYGDLVWRVRDYPSTVGSVQPGTAVRFSPWVSTDGRSDSGRCSLTHCQGRHGIRSTGTTQPTTMG